jgi:signal transduction histidine kinase
VLTNPPVDDPVAITRADAAAWLWDRRGETSPVARRALTLPSGPALVVWTSTSARLDGLIAGPTYLSSLAAGVIGGAEAWAISDLEGRPLLGDVPPAGQTAVRTALTTGLPWTVHVFAPDGQALPMSPRRPLLLLVLGLVTVVLATGWYFIYRALTRERQVAALQSDFVAAVSHEFRSPLTALSHAADLLVEDRLPSEASRHQMYTVLARDTSRLRALVEGLLEFGRLEAGAVTYRFESTDVSTLVRSVVADFRESTPARGYTIELAGAASAIHASVDREALGRSLRNLLDNAVKYSPDSRAIRVEVSQNDGFVNIAVQDDGIGIPAAEQRAVFDRFVRGAESKSRGIHGTGIGLALVRQTVRAHGGDVEVASEPGRGSVFTIRIPASTGPAAEGEGVDRPARHAEAARS